MKKKENYRFVVSVKHDHGTKHIEIFTTDEETAKHLAMEAEGCPLVSIQKVTVEKQCVVVTVSRNMNSFGLYGMVIMAKDGTAFEIAVSTLEKRPKGSVIIGKIVNGELSSISGVSYEIPRKLPVAPIEVVNEVWK